MDSTSPIRIDLLLADVLGADVHAEVLQKLLRAVVAHLLLAMVHRGDLDDDREVSAGLDGDGDNGDLDAEDLHILVVHAHAVIDLFTVPQLEVDDQIDLLADLDRADTEDTAGVDDTDTAQLDKMADVGG